MQKLSYLFIIICQIIFTGNSFAQNPLIMNQFTADPTARVFEGKIYIYPSHDIRAVEGKGRVGWFCMEDYHVFSSEDFTEWKDYGVILSQNHVPWIDSTTYSMWAPDCIYRNGKYYFYFPSKKMDKEINQGKAIGVAVSDKPYGQFFPEPKPIEGITGIDPNVFIDKDGQAYIYWARTQNIYMAKLKTNMLEIDSPPQLAEGLPKGFKEGPFMFERKGIYYLTFPYVIDSTETIAYSTADNPMGPFKYAGVIMDESPTGCWTNHQSMIEFKNQWYLFYHHNDLSPNFDKNRSTRCDSLFFNEDGTIKKVIPTLRGVGVTKASQKIQIDRYSNISEKGASIAFIDTSNRFSGWKVILDKKNAWIKYNSVDFGSKEYKTVIIKASSENGGNLQIHLNSVDGPLISEIKIPKGKELKEISTYVPATLERIHNLVLVLKDNKPVEIDWISFK